MNADEWNAAYPVGTPVRYWSGARQGFSRRSKTCTRAWTIGSGASLVGVKGCNDRVNLSYVEALTEREQMESTTGDWADTDTVPGTRVQIMTLNEDENTWPHGTVIRAQGKDKLLVRTDECKTDRPYYTGTMEILTLDDSGPAMEIATCGDDHGVVLCQI